MKYYGKISDVKDLVTKEYADTKVEQATTMPTASAYYLGRLIQCADPTSTEYTFGYFYECKYDSSTSAYKWEAVNVQAGGSGDYLPLSGGTMTGPIIDTYLKKSANNGAQVLYGGTGYGNGAQLSLYGKSSGSGGAFFLKAQDDTEYTQLQGEPSGDLLWDGVTIYKPDTVEVPAGNWGGDLYLYRCGKMRVLGTRYGAYFTAEEAFTLESGDRPMNRVYGTFNAGTNPIAALLINTNGKVYFYWGTKSSAASYTGQVVWFVA